MRSFPAIRGNSRNSSREGPNVGLVDTTYFHGQMNTHTHTEIFTQSTVIFLVDTSIMVIEYASDESAIGIEGTKRTRSIVLQR